MLHAHFYWCLFIVGTLIVSFVKVNDTDIQNIRGSGDKPLARPGRKQATATQLGICPTYSPRSSLHFLARCSNFFQPLKKNSEGCPSNHVSAAALISASDEKWRTFNCFFSVQRTGCSRRVQIRRIGWVIKTLEAQVGHYPLGCKWPVSKNKTLLVTFPRRFFFKMSFSCTSRNE